MLKSSHKENLAATSNVRGVRLAFFSKNAHHHRMKLKLKDLRNKRGWTQEQLADIVGCTKSHISEMESGKKNASSPMLESLATAFGVHVVELIDAGEAGDLFRELYEVTLRLPHDQVRTLVRMARGLENQNEN